MSKHTKGPVRVASEETVTVRDETDAYICSFGWLKGPHGLGCRRSDAEVIANANLVAEAFNIAAETGLTPRQLADQRAELLGALKAMTDAFLDTEGSHGTMEQAATAAAYRAIANAEQ